MEFAKKLKGDFTEFNMAFPYPGTEFYKMGIEQGLFTEADLYVGNDQHKSGLRTVYLSNDELDELRKKGEKSILLSPSYIWSTLSQIRSPKVFLNYVKYGSRLVADMMRSK